MGQTIIMEKEQQPVAISNVRSLTRSGYFWITVIAVIAFFFISHFLTHSIDPGRDEEMSVFVTAYFFTGIFIGRYLSQLWIAKHPITPNSRLISLVVTIVICMVLVFLATQFVIIVQKLSLGFILVGLPLLAMSTCLGMLIKLIRTNVKNQLQDAKATAEHSQSELKLLQSQLSPHFLFNTLNNIYGISLSQHEKVPTLLLKLSSLLRYSVYDAREQFVPLKSELEYIENYIDFEKIRIGEKLVLYTEIEKLSDQDIKIAPMLLIVFVENAFKHAKNTTEQQILIDIRVKIWGDVILFSVKNSNKGVAGQKSILNKNSGFGLDNVTRRLDLLYKGAYGLQIIDKEGYYDVLLQLKIMR
jgi:sensor histidine kinase YesM